MPALNTLTFFRRSLTFNRAIPPLAREDNDADNGNTSGPRKINKKNISRNQRDVTNWESFTAAVLLTSSEANTDGM